MPQTPTPVGLPNYDIASITTVDGGLELIRQNLIALRGMATMTDFGSKAQVRSFCDNIAFLRQYYERVDRLLTLGEPS
jgi:hypothetical protein